ncbi:MAG: LuxR C-terminal-related transcriptional regulator [Roseiflexaceae bacterium]|nr:LuxR C-terminal-related transcriptional regulator [Roseiflexaceae bacterium]
MIDNDDFRQIFDAAPLAGLSVTIHSGLSGLVRITASYLVEAGARLEPDAPLHVVIDAPPLFAYHWLIKAQSLQSSTIVVTSNACPEYIADLWELRPAAVIVGGDVQSDVIKAVWRVSQGERYCMTPSGGHVAGKERDVLRYVASGWGFSAIAAHLGLSPKTVRNKVSAIYQRLGLMNRSELTLYYLGLLQP